MPLLDARRPLVLGSASPRRREMLAWTGVPVVALSAEIDETPRADEAPTAYLGRVAMDKLEAVRALAPAGAGGVLVADTVVIAPGGAILGKPTSDDDACAMVLRLAGATHEVSTRFLLGTPARGEPPAHAETVTTRVTFRPLGRAEARAYAATGEGRDKAGAYAVQGRAAAFIVRLEGSYTGVVGLPLSEVLVAMRGLGWIEL